MCVYTYTHTYTYIHTVEYCSAIKKNEIMLCSNMDATRDYHTKWSKSERDRQISYDITYMWNLKIKHRWTYLWDRNRLTDRGETCGCQRGGQGREGLGVWD